MDKRQHESDLGPFSLPEVQPDHPSDKERIGLESADVGKASELAIGKSIERSFGNAGSGAPGATSHTTTATGVNPTLPVGAINQSRNPLSPPASSRLNAEDKDRIEKEWVNIAKAIVEETKADPYNQKKEVNKISKDYVKKRFNLDLKIDENG